MSVLLSIMAAVTPVAVAQTGISLGSALTAGGVWTCVVTLLTVLARQRYPMKKLALGSEEKLREDLFAQLKKQDVDHDARVTKLEGMVDDQRKAYEAKLEYERVIHSNEVKVMRHRMNNLDQCLTMLLALIETNPEKAQDAARRVREMREKQEASEVLEKATIAAAVTVAVAVPPSPNPTVP